MNAAIDRACEQKYAINKYPFIVLNMELNPSHIDVNVHPAKLEVKFDDETAVFNAIYSAVRGTIEQNNRETSPFTQARIQDEEKKIEQISKDIKNNGMLGNYSDNITKKFDFDIATKVVSTNIEDTSNNESEKVENITQNVVSNDNISLNEEVNEIYTTNTVETVDNSDTKIAENTEVVNNIFENKPQENAFKFENVEVEKYDEQDIIPEEQIKPYTYIGQVFNTYIVIQIAEKMYIIDQHAAHERLLYEQIKDAYYAKDRESQILLMPILVELTNKEKNIVDENIEMFEKAGFMIEEFGENTIKISGVPNIGYEIEYKSMFKDIIDDLLGATKTEQKEKEFRFIATLACKAAVKGRMKLDREEQITLIDNMMKLENPFTCPHGRPTAYELSKYEIERRFLRK